MTLESQLRARALRTLAHGDRRALAAAAGWHYATLCNWLTGVRSVSSVVMLERLAAALGVRLAVVERDG